MSFLNYVKKIDDNKQQSYSSTFDGTLSIITDEQVLKKGQKGYQRKNQSHKPKTYWQDYGG